MFSALVRLWDIDKGTERAVLRVASAPYEYASPRTVLLLHARRPDPRHGHQRVDAGGVSVDFPAQVKLWDAKTGQERVTIDTRQYGDVTATQFTADGRFLLARFGGVGVLDPTQYALLRPHNQPPTASRRAFRRGRLPPGPGARRGVERFGPRGVRQSLRGGPRGARRAAEGHAPGAGEGGSARTLDDRRPGRRSPPPRLLARRPDPGPGRVEFRPPGTRRRGWSWVSSGSSSMTSRPAVRGRGPPAPTTPSSPPTAPPSSRPARTPRSDPYPGRRPTHTPTSQAPRSVSIPCRPGPTWPSCSVPPRSPPSSRSGPPGGGGALRSRGATAAGVVALVASGFARARGFLRRYMLVIAVVSVVALVLGTVRMYRYHERAAEHGRRAQFYSQLAEAIEHGIANGDVLSSVQIGASRLPDGSAVRVVGFRPNTRIYYPHDAPTPADYPTTQRLIQMCRRESSRQDWRKEQCERAALRPWLTVPPDPPPPPGPQ